MLPIEGVTTATEVPRILEGAKLSFVLALRQAFASTFTHPSLRYTSGADTSIKIFTAHPLVMEFMPCIVVSAASGNASFGYLQDDFVREDPDSYSQYYSGKVTFNLALTIYTGSTLEREKIIDHLIFYIRHLFRGTFHNFNLEYTKNISVGSENVYEVDNKPVYEQTMSIECYMEYKAVVDQSQMEEIRKIILESVDYPDGISLEDMDKPENADRIKTIEFP